MNKTKAMQLCPHPNINACSHHMKTCGKGFVNSNLYYIENKKHINLFTYP